MPDERDSTLWERLQRDAENGSPRCGQYLATLDPLFRTEIYTALLYERLERKMRLVEELHEEIIARGRHPVFDTNTQAILEDVGY